MVTVVSTAVTASAIGGCMGPNTATSHATSSTTYVDVNELFMTNVPVNAKIYYAFYISMSSADTGYYKMTDGDADYDYIAETAVTTTSVYPRDLSGTLLQDQGTAQTVKMQFRVTGVTDIMTWRNDSSGTSWMAYVSMSVGDPIIITTEDQGTVAAQEEWIFNGKRQIDSLLVLNIPHEDADPGKFYVNVMGNSVKYIDPQSTEADDFSGSSFTPNVMTSELRVRINDTSHAHASIQGVGIIIVAWSGFNIEVTG